MQKAVRAPVKPRFVSSETGATLPLEDEVRRLLEEAGPKLIRIDGPPGSGKTTALSHLAAVLPNATRLRLFDNNDDVRQAEWAWKDDVVVFAAACPQTVALPQTMPRTLSLNLAPWERDDLIEYLLARHPAQCAAVMSRISRDAEREFAGIPEIWTAILNDLAADPALTDPEVALVHRLWARTPTVALWHHLESVCVQADACGLCAAELLAVQPGPRPPAVVFRMLRHPPVGQLVAAERLAADLKDPWHPCKLPPRISRELVQAVARRIAGNKAAVARLGQAMEKLHQQPIAASLLCAVDRAWRPPPKWSLFHANFAFYLAEAYLSGVLWSGLDLRDTVLTNADFSRADLRKADLRGVHAPGADFGNANLANASLVRLCAFNADFRGADLSSVRGKGVRFDNAKLCGATLDFAVLEEAAFTRADLRRASLRRANLRNAILRSASIDETDFSGADLTEAAMEGLDLRSSRLNGAKLRNARLMRANLEGMRLDGIDLSGARLQEALLTGSSMVRGDLRKSSLRGAGLADVSWEGALLCGADLRDASFHMGSSRSGLVGSPYVSEGTRTGFYTDDYGDQDFKSPEEIRKADLRNADLRGALLNNTDFYLVDLRGARYDLDQEVHFRRCGAILEDRCPRDH